MSLDEAINHPLFEQVRSTEQEQTNTQPIDLDFESLNLTNSTLRELFLKEISRY